MNAIEKRPNIALKQVTEIHELIITMTNNQTKRFSNIKTQFIVESRTY
jgi:hypothetical protein